MSLRSINEWAIPWLVGVVLSLLLVGARVDDSLADFTNYYFGASLFSDGHSLKELYEPITFNELIAERFDEPLYSNVAVLPPSTILLSWPLQWLSPYPAKWCLLLVSMVWFCWAIVRMLQFLRLDPRWLWLIIPACIPPLASNFYQGQVYLLLFALLVEGWLAYERKRWWASALCWSLAVGLKIFPLALMLLLLHRRDWKQMFRWTAVLVLSWAMTLPWIGWTDWYLYAVEVFPKVSSGYFSDPFANAFQSHGVLLRKMLVEDAVLNPNPIAHHPSLAAAIILFVKLAALWFVWDYLKKTTTFGGFATVILLVLAFSGYGTVYSLVLLIPLMVMLLEQGPRNLLPMILLVLIWWLPVHEFNDAPLPLQFPRMWLFFALFLLVTRPQWNRRQLGFLMVAGLISAGVWMLPGETMPGKRIQNEQGVLLTHELEWEDGVLYGRYYDRQGGGQRALLHGVQPPEFIELDRPDWGNVRSACLIGGDSLVVLTDWGRGYRFYDAWLIHPATDEI